MVRLPELYTEYRTFVVSSGASANGRKRQPSTNGSWDGLILPPCWRAHAPARNRPAPLPTPHQHARRNPNTARNEFVGGVEVVQETSDIILRLSRQHYLDGTGFVVLLIGNGEFVALKPVH